MTMSMERLWRSIDSEGAAKAQAASEVLALRCPSQYCRVERLEVVDRLDALRPHIPLEHPQHDLVGGKIRDREAVLLDRLHIFVHIEMGGRALLPRRAGSPKRRGSAPLAFLRRTRSRGRKAPQ